MSLVNGCSSESNNLSVGISLARRNISSSSGVILHVPRTFWDSATKYALSLGGQNGGALAAPGEPKGNMDEAPGAGNMDADLGGGTYVGELKELNEGEAAAPGTYVEAGAGGNMEAEAAPGEPKELEAAGNILKEADALAALEAPGPDLNVNVKGFPQLRQLRSDNLF